MKFTAFSVLIPIFQIPPHFKRFPLRKLRDECWWGEQWERLFTGFPVWRLWNRVDKRVHALHATVGECILQLWWTQCELWLMVEPTQWLALHCCGQKVNLVQGTERACCAANPFWFTSPSLQVYILQSRKHIMQLCILSPSKFFPTALCFLWTLTLKLFPWLALCCSLIE